MMCVTLDPDMNTVCEYSRTKSFTIDGRSAKAFYPPLCPTHLSIALKEGKSGTIYLRGGTFPQINLSIARILHQATGKEQHGILLVCAIPMPYGALCSIKETAARRGGAAIALHRRFPYAENGTGRRQRNCTPGILLPHIRTGRDDFLRRRRRSLLAKIASWAVAHTAAAISRISNVRFTYMSPLWSARILDALG